MRSFDTDCPLTGASFNCWIGVENSFFRYGFNGFWEGEFSGTSVAIRQEHRQNDATDPEEYWMVAGTGKGIQTSAARLEFGGLPSELDIRPGKSGPVGFVVKCLDRNDKEIAGCKWELAITVENADNGIGGHVQGPSFHDPICRPIGQLQPGFGTECEIGHKSSSAMSARLTYILETIPTAGRMTFKATCPEQPDCLPASKTLDLRVPAREMVPMCPNGINKSCSTGTLSVIGQTDEHPTRNWFASPMLKERLEGAAQQFKNLLGLSGMPSKPLMASTDISLEWGGLYDVVQDATHPAGKWQPPHKSHGSGIAADIRINYPGLTTDQNFVVQRFLKIALEANRLSFIPSKFPKYLPEGPCLDVPFRCADHFHVVPTKDVLSAAIRSNSESMPSTQALQVAVVGTSTAVDGGQYRYSYILSVPSDNGSAVDGWSTTVAGTPTAILTPAGWSASVVANGVSSAILFTANGGAVDAQGINVNGLAPGGSLSGFSFVSPVAAGTVTFRASGAVVSIAEDEEEAERLLENGGARNVVEGTAVGPPPMATMLVPAPAALAFTAVKADPSGPLSNTTPPAVVNVAFTGTTPTWTASSDRPWLQITGGTGSGAGQLTATIVNPSNVIGGAKFLTATITVSAYAADPVEIPVSLTLHTPAPFSDEPLISGATTIKAIHITELRLRIDALRTQYGLQPRWIDSPLTAGVTGIQAQHIIDLRAALLEVYTATGLTAPTFTEPALIPGMVIKAIHLSELRSAVAAIE